MGRGGIEDGPYHYHDRLFEHVISGTKHLKVFVPERHDFVLMKMIRGQQNDLETVVEMHKAEPLLFDRLLELIASEMTAITGNKRRIKPNFLNMFETLFGETMLHMAESRLKAWELS